MSYFSLHPLIVMIFNKIKNKIMFILMSLCHFLYKALIYNMFSGDIM